MDTKTPPIPFKQQERKENQQRKEEKSPERVSLPPLTTLPDSCRKQHHERTKNPGPSAPWNRGPPQISRNSGYQRGRPYRVLDIGATPLMHACQQGDRCRVLRLLKEQENTVGYRDRTLRSALHYCMDAGTGGAVASAAPELVNASDAEGHTPIHLAVIAGDTQLVAVLLANGADVNAKDLEGHSVLHWATVCGEAECVRLVLAAGARPSTPDLRGGSPLHYAAQCCGAAVTAELSVPKKVGLKVLQTLLEFEADVNAKDEDGRQPILWAASAGSVEAVLALARAGGSAAAGATDKDGLTALHCAASRGHARCVEALVNLCGSHPDHVDDNGCSALHYAATLGHADATALLLRLGADPNRQDRKGRTPALCAAAKGQLETLKILAQHGGSLHARTVRGTGVAHEAVLSGRIELIEWLAKKRPSTLDVATHDGKTPLHVAALHGYLDVCKVLLDHGARINAVLRTSKSGPMTALDAALYRGHRDCAKLVQMHGGTTAQHLRTHKTAAPNRVFAAKLRVKRDDSSSSQNESSDNTESSSSSSRRRRRRGHRETDLYFEEQWIKKRTRRRAAGSNSRKGNNRRGSRSYSEEEIRLGKSSESRDRRRRRRRRARSESARYEACPSLERSERKIIRKRPGKHEYGESSSETSQNSSNEGTGGARRRLSRSREDSKTERASKDSDDKKEGSIKDFQRSEESEEDDKSLSDDSLEVVVVKKSLEKTSEKVQISGRKLKSPRETSRKTRITETRRKSSRKKSKTDKSEFGAEGIEVKDEERSKVSKKFTKTMGSDGSGSKTEEQFNRGMVRSRIEEKKVKDRQCRKDVTDSTSQETVERVTVTALVHKDQAPDTPKGLAERRKRSVTAAPSKKENKNSSEDKDNVDTGATVAKTEMDDMLEKADRLQNELMTKAADLRKDVEDIRRQMSSESSQDGRTPRDTQDRKASGETGDEPSEGSDEPVTVKGRRNDETKSETTSEDSQQEFSRLQSQREKVITSPSSSTGREGPVEDTIGDEEEGKDKQEKSPKSRAGEKGDVVIEEKEKWPSNSEKSHQEEDAEGTSASENLSSRPSTAKHEILHTSHESASSPTTGQKSGDNKLADRCKQSPTEGEKCEELIDKDSRRESEDEDSRKSRSSREKALETLSDENEGTTEATCTERSKELLDAEEKVPADFESATPEETQKGDKILSDTEGNKEGSECSASGKLRFIDGCSSGSAKSRSRPSTGKNGRGEARTKSASKSPSKRSLFESSEERSPDRSAIVAVIESPEWDDDDDEEIEKEIRDAVGEDEEEGETEPEDDDDADDDLGVLRVLPSTSEEETPRITSKILRGPKTEVLPTVERKLRIKHEGETSPHIPQGVRAGRAKQRKDSGGRDSGIEPSPRVSKIPRRTFKCYPNTEKQQALNMETVTRDVQISLRRYHLERKIFFQLMELKRLQIRHGRANEHVLVKRQVETFHKAGMTGPTLGVAKYDQPLTFRHFEAFLYEQLRRLQRRPATPDFCTEAKQCTQKTHRCHHATSAYTSVPVYTYLGGGGQDREEGLLPRIESRGRGQMTVEVTRGEEKQVIALPTEKLDRTKRYFVTFTVRGEGHQENESSTTVKAPRNAAQAQKNMKSV